MRRPDTVKWASPMYETPLLLGIKRQNKRLVLLEQIAAHVFYYILRSYYNFRYLANSRKIKYRGFLHLLPLMLFENQICFQRCILHR